MVHADTYLKAIVLTEERELWVDVVIVYQNLVHHAPQESESNTGWASHSQRLPDVIRGGKGFSLSQPRHNIWASRWVVV